MHSNAALSKPALRLVDPRTASRLIGEALAAHAMVRLEASNPRLRSGWIGTIVGGDEQHLQVQLKDAYTDDRTPHSDDALKAHVFLGLDRYCFDTRCIDREVRATQISLSIETPDRLYSVDRRRNARRTLHQAITVTLTSANPSGGRASGVLLNLSTDGLACKVAHGDLENFALGGGLTASFALSDFPAAVELRARLVSCTESQPGFCVVGLEFLSDEASKRARFQLETMIGSSGAFETGATA